METIQLDREQAFLLYATFAGDLERTAHACGVRAVDILRCADEEGWNDRLKGVLELKKSNRPGDFERAINRAINFADAHRFRLFLERVLNRLAGMSPEDLETYLLHGASTPTGCPIKKLSTRALADLASALEKCQSLTYMALTDTAQDRVKRKEAEEAGESGGELHARIADAMSKLRVNKTIAGQLLEAQVIIAEEKTFKAKAAEAQITPYDKDR
jgi:hypothetical protein